MTFLPTSYNLLGVMASVVIASFASYVTLDLARRVRRPERTAAALWWAGGSIVMGTGIWAMHFVGMLAFSVPIVLGYGYGLTLASWLAAVATSGIALGIASLGALTWGRVVAGASVMGLGICAMHYTGMAALDMAPGIVWNMGWVVASAVIAVVASGVALGLFFWLRAFNGVRRMLYQLLAAGAMGLAISGMHYTGMAGAGFPEGAVCLSADALGGPALAVAVAAACLLMLSLTLVIATLDSRMQARTGTLNSSLQQANAQLQSANDELHRRAFSDPLTGLPNRLLFEDRLAHALSRSERTADRISSRRTEKIGVLFVDLDGFKPVNDSFGHAAGDQVLKEAAARLQGMARESDTVARVGGDEFLMLVEDAGNVADCMTLANRIVEALGRPFDIAERQVQIACSIGIVVWPDQGQREKLVANADAAMYAAKRNGGNSYALFESHMDHRAGEQLGLQSDLRMAIERGQLALHYQPKIDGLRGQIHGVEALLRWQHPEHGMVPPDVFIPMAERFGLINKLGAWVIDEACRQMQAWADAGVRMRVSINLSVHQLREPDLVSRIEQALRRNFVPPAHLLCEITESVAMEDIKATQRAFEDLARIGVFLSIDDFGTGYSSLSYLRQLPARQLKIDRSFVQDLESSNDARAVVDAVVRLSHALGLRVVAEGVETAGQSDILLEMGCDELQGYFFARPMPAEMLLAWTEGRKPSNAVDFSPSVVGGL
ncbi:bifunctional diguanylate cyclase/phosphodiesterase [Pseudorhodoferax sp. Leaf267]|uniref:putative bifunctional diguanylate cyclase/phosphodiesterase n=1 Tax=Pseudorhodoferax sp. Leaf267 TaxID=1736316 RepID=UPI0006FC81E3|nr:bifunctional diguanylate cyclase/phosphodiesterase [Pseudorhodoferax sp. Leaf267]KQP14726.1 diguanylate phosphodiesterase [Pseudorhodoferax sp. Leaf267]